MITAINARAHGAMRTAMKRISLSMDEVYLKL
jgi:hypothetical protein